MLKKSEAVDLETIKRFAEQQLPTRQLPPLRSLPPEDAPVIARARPSKRESVVQLCLSLRKSQRRQLVVLALNADMTLRAFVLNALRDKGLTVHDDDLLDKRRRQE